MRNEGADQGRNVSLPIRYSLRLESLVPFVGALRGPVLLSAESIAGGRSNKPLRRHRSMRAPAQVEPSYLTRISLAVNFPPFSM
jgi:hypothetical protein